MQFEAFEHLHHYERVHDIRLNISYSNIQPFTLREFRRKLPDDLDLNWTDPSGPLRLRKLIAKRHRTTADRVLVTAGATEANFLTDAALLSPGDRVLVDSPTYSPLRACPAGFGARVNPVPRDCEEGWTLDLDRWRRAGRPKTRLAVFANLNNPTSATMSRSNIDELADWAEECKAFVLVDETFRELAFNRTPPSVAGFGPRMVAISTVTKVCGLGGLRVGWAVADVEVLDRLKAVKDYTTICGSSVTQLLAEWALGRWEFFLNRAKVILDRNRKIAREALSGLRGLRGDVPDAGTVMFPHCEVNVRELAERLLRRYKTVIADGRFFGSEDHFRLGLGGASDDLHRGLENLRSALRASTA